MASSTKKTERFMVRLEEGVEERVEVVREQLAAKGPDVNMAATLRYLVKRGLETVEGELRLKPKREIR